MLLQQPRSGFVLQLWKFSDVCSRHTAGVAGDDIMFHILVKLIYLRQYLNYSVDQKLKMWEMLMAIFLVYSPSGITSSKKVCRDLKMVVFLNFFKY